jgi:DNA-damage-inducible protein J
MLKELKTMTKTLQIRVDDELKSAVDDLYSAMGLDISTAVRMFFHASLQTSAIPFPVQRVFNAETEAARQEARDIAAGKIKAKSYKSVKAMLADLDAETAE